MTDMAKLLELTQSGDPSAALRSMIEEGSIPDSRRQVLQMLLSQQTTLDASEEALIDAAPDAQTARSDNREITAFAQQIEAQQSLLHDLADAIGACGECFGVDEDCEHCGGQGAPGAFAPDPEAFAFFVRPALEKMSLRRARRAAGSSNTQLISKGVR